MLQIYWEYCLIIYFPSDCTISYIWIYLTEENHRNIYHKIWNLSWVPMLGLLRYNASCHPQTMISVLKTKYWKERRVKKLIFLSTCLHLQTWKVFPEAGLLCDFTADLNKIPNCRTGHIGEGSKIITQRGADVSGFCVAHAPQRPASISEGLGWRILPLPHRNENSPFSCSKAFHFLLQLFYNIRMNMQ
jgi:hypothetical protein